MTGQRALYANAIYAVGVEGMGEQDGQALLRDVYTMASVPEYQCRVSKIAL